MEKTKTAEGLKGHLTDAVSKAVNYDFEFGCYDLLVAGWSAFEPKVQKTLLNFFAHDRQDGMFALATKPDGTQVSPALELEVQEQIRLITQSFHAFAEKSPPQLATPTAAAKEGVDLFISRLVNFSDQSALKQPFFIDQLVKFLEEE